MKTLPHYQKNLLFLILVSSLVSCSSGPIVQEFPNTADPAQEITNLESELKMAKNNRLDVLSPNHYKEASEALSDAKDALASGDDREDILKEVALGKAYLRSAESSAQVAKSNIDDVIVARDAAVTAEAPLYFEKKFKDVDDDLKDLTEDVEKNKLSNIPKEKAKLQERYVELEIMAIKEKNLKESREGIDLAKKEKASKYAPRTLGIAEESLASTEAFIAKNPHKEWEIQKRVQETNKAVNHAIEINRAAQNSQKVSLEEMALLLEQERLRAEAKASQLSYVEDRLESTQSALEREKSATASLESSKEYLEAQKRLDEKYEAARKQFAPDEAEVYKQGDALVIRLKGMEFKSAKSQLQPKNEQLLSKVQKVMEEFGPSTVVVEGHTDSVGGKIINDRLSKNRAEVVKKYLESNEGGLWGESAKIEAVGYGYQKPLATNKTANGRAKNRRVDIVIKPDNSKM